jgi:predicted Kef-type K+ transport protein
MFVSKTVPSALIVKFSKLRVRPTQFGIGISQIGEFSFVLGSLAFKEGLITTDQFTGLLLAVVISILGSTLLARKIKSPDLKS